VILVLVQIVNLLARILTIIVIVDIVLSYFMSPFNTIRQTLDRLVEPMLMPIRRIVPSVGMLDFSPFILIILIQVIAYVLTNLLFSIG
jgi:YggT family protein